MEATQSDRCRNMILGALVADAAAMGLHWIYDQPHIRKIAPEAPEFRMPDARDYDGVMAFFAHPTRKAGAQSQYGEQAMVMLRSLAASRGRYHSADFAEAFHDYFGYGGGYVGYIDHATKETLDNQRRYEDAARACAASLPFDAEPRIAKTLLTKALPMMARHEGAKLRTAFEEAVRAEHTDEAIIAYAMALLAALEKLDQPTGAFDLQLPAIAKLPGLVAVLIAQGRTDTFNTDIATAIQVTNNHPVAAEYGHICAEMMRGALTTGSCSGAIAAAHASAQGDVARLLSDAAARSDQSHESVTKHFGMACDLPFGVPSAAHNIATAPSYREAIRRNIYGGGDTCGRAILVGAVMGAVHGLGGAQGIPQEWIDQLAHKVEVDDILETLFG